MKKRLLSMILAISMMLTILPVNAITAWAADDKSGACGDGLTYTMSQNDGTDTYTLAITKSGTGTGAMTDYSYGSGYKPVPWYAELNKITKLTIAGATSIGNSAFEDCHKLADVTILGSVTSIGKEAFEGCNALTNTSISNILKEATSIGEGAFRGCTSLTSVEIPESVTSIDVAAFGQCSNLTSVKILGTITSIAASTFIDCGKLNNFDIPVSVTSIGDWAFARCSGLADIEIPEKVTSIGNHAFENCTSLTTIKIPDSVTSIGENAFNGCSSLRQVDLPSVIPTISQGAFNNANTRFYYPGYAKDFNAQVGQIATGNIGMQTYRVCCYRDVFFDANGGSFADSSTRKKVEKIWRETKLTQVQVDSIGAPKQSGKIFLGWNTTANATTTINPIYGDTADGTIYYAVYKDAVPAAVTIDGLDGTTVKAGEAKEFTVNVTPNDDANTGAKATITVSGANADAVEKIQYKDGETWKDVPGEGLSIDKINNTEFKLITKADANDGDVTITVTAKKANDTEIDKKVAAVTVKKHENAAVTIDGLDHTTVKAGEVKDFTVNVTPNDDTIDKVTFVTTSGEVQWSNDGGKTWTPVSDDVAYSNLTGKQFRVVPAADAANGTVTVTVTAKKADGTEIAKTATFTVTAREHATVAINNLNGETIKQNKPHTFTVTVTANDDSGDMTVKFDSVEGLSYNDAPVTAEGIAIKGLTAWETRTLNLIITPAEAGNGKTLKAALSNAVDVTATYNVSAYEHAKVTIDGLGTDLKQGESKDFTVKVDPKDDSGNAIIDFGDKNSEIQYKDGEDWKPMPSGGLEIDLSETHDFRITPKNDGSQTLTATVKQNDNELGKVEQTYTVAKKDEPTTPGGGENPGENPGGGSTGGGENPGGGSTGGGENPGENPGGGSGNTKPTPKPDEKPDRKIKIDGGIVEVNGKEVKPDEDGNITVKKGDEITITVDKSKISDAQVFDQWVIKPDSVLNEVDPKSEKISFTMPAEDVTIEAMTRDASIEDDGPGILGTGALIATGVVGSAALLYQGHMLGTELYLRYLLPHGAVIPQNRAELAVLLWQDAENPEPVSTTLYSDISDEDSAIQQAARWAVENDLMEQLDAEEHPDHFDPFVPVTFSDSIRAWKKAQELKKSVH